MFSAVKIHSDSLFVYNSGLCGYLAKRLVHGIIHCRQVLSKSLTCLKGKHADANAPGETTLRRLHSAHCAQDPRTETGERMSFGLWRQLDEMPLRRTSLDNNVWKWQTRLSVYYTIQYNCAGASIPLRPWCNFPPYFRFPIFSKKFQTLENFQNVTFSWKISRFSSAKISNDLLFYLPYVYFVSPPTLTMMHSCITQCTYWTPLQLWIVFVNCYLPKCTHDILFTALSNLEESRICSKSRVYTVIAYVDLCLLP